MERLDSNKKPYGIICNVRLWKYIKPKLQEWKYYSIKGFNEDWSKPAILLIRTIGGVGLYNKFNLPTNFDFEIKLIHNVDEFLTKAAELTGFNYELYDKNENMVKLTVEQIEDILDIPHGNLIIIE